MLIHGYVAFERPAPTDKWNADGRAVRLPGHDSVRRTDERRLLRTTTRCAAYTLAMRSRRQTNYPYTLERTKMIVRIARPRTAADWPNGPFAARRLFASHWGNATFAVPEPFESVARAATFHDFGYLRYETAPAFNAETGQTPNFRDVITDEKRCSNISGTSIGFSAPIRTPATS